MGTGKSTVGRELARLLGTKFIDLDEELEKALGMSVKDIWVEKGEAFFRLKEKELALELAKTSNRVIATGGGTLLLEEVREAFLKSGLIICLFAEKKDLVARLERGGDKRPILNESKALPEKVDKLLDERAKIYDKISIRVNTTDLSPQEAAKKIMYLLKERQRILDKLQNEYIVIS